MQIDLVLTSRDDSPPRADVWDGIASQAGVEIRVHRIFGPRRPGDRNRWDTIARARNLARRQVSGAWVMFLDDDVVLGPGCVAALLGALQSRPGFAAMAADYDGEMKRWGGSWDHPPHVGMGATLFRGECLATVTFRWESGKCECQCCCDDLRNGGWGIGLVPDAPALHRPERSRSRPAPEPPPLATASKPASKGPRESVRLPGRILAAFDRAHFRKFRAWFLASLRASGNLEPVTVCAYGLHPSEIRVLRADGVEVVAIDPTDRSPALRRLEDFPGVIERWPEETPVAYWDAGDVQFRGRLGPLWDLVRANPEVLLAVREPATHPESPAIRDWIPWIIDPGWRRRVFDLLVSHPFLNSGFAAGTPRALIRYFREGSRLLRSDVLRGVGHWGDQMALNVFCHTQAGVWAEIPESWNYCLAVRPAGQYRCFPSGWVERTDGEPIHVIHGNGGSLVWQGIPVLA